MANNDSACRVELDFIGETPLTICSTCANRPHCETLCATAEVLANVDYTPREEELMINPDLMSWLNSHRAESMPVNNGAMGEQELIIRMWGEGISQSKIAEQLYLTKQRVNYVIQKTLRWIADQDRRGH